MIRNEYQGEFGLHANQKRVAGEELVHRMAIKWEKVVDETALHVLGRELIICGRPVKWRDEELRHK